MSLILEALKKLEREKGVPERGFTVLAATPWPARHRDRRIGLLAAGLLVAGGIALGVALRPTPQAAPTAVPAAAPSSLAAVLKPAPVPTTVTAAPAVFPTPWRRSAAPTPAPPPAEGAPVAVPAERPAPPPTTAPAAEPLRLQAISERDGHPVAVLNERIVREGDEFDGIRVLRIGPGEVEVEVRGRRRILTF
jgi:hypothetical protein